MDEAAAGSDAALMDTTETTVCPKCQRLVPADAPHGLCLSCLGAVLGGASDALNEGVFALEFGPYELLNEIGRGGAGVVFCARDRRTGATVALKVLTSGRFASSAERDRFAREAQAVAGLRHPGIVPFLDVGEEDGQPYLAMRWIEGQSLADQVRRRLPPLKEAVATIRQVALAVHHAHEHGIVHRDLKPSNILITPAGEVCVVDFGLARHLERDITVTRSGEALGTPGFMPPEQCGQRSSPLGPAADVYALGSVLYFVLTGRPPFLAGTHHETIAQLLKDEPVPPRQLNSAIPRDLETICLKCLEKEPHKRYASAEALADDLERFLRDEPILARPIGPIARSWRWCRRHRTVTASAALIIVLVAGFSWHNWRTVTALRNTAPSLIALAESLMTAQKFPEALERVEVALRLRPRNGDYHVLKGNILLALLRVAEARDAYRHALHLDDSLDAARQGLTVCDALLAARRPNGDWPKENLLDLYHTLVEQGRSPEAYAVFRRLDAEETRHVEFLQSRLTAAGVTNRFYWRIQMPAGLREKQTGPTNSLTPHSSRLLELELKESSLGDLAVLRGMPLNVLGLALCPNVSDLQPLQGMPLVKLSLVHVEVSDLRPLAGMPLEFLWIGNTRVQDLGPLKAIPTLRVLFVHNVDVRDLGPLRGLALDHLEVGSTLVTSIEPLRGMPLTTLEVRYCNVTDLTPLAGSSITHLHLHHLDISDIGPLRSLPLRYLRLHDCPLLVDISPLKDCKSLEQLVLPPNARDIEFLRDLPNLKEISYSEQMLPAAEFWKSYEARKTERK